MISHIKEISDLYHASHVDEIKRIEIAADRLGMKDIADKIFALRHGIEKSLAKTANNFVGMKNVIKAIELLMRD